MHVNANGIFIYKEVDYFAIKIAEKICSVFLFFNRLIGTSLLLLFSLKNNNYF